MTTPIRILLADDHQMVREGLKSLLAKESGMEIIGEAANGRELLHLLAQHPVDVAVVDIGMPEMDGYEAAKKILELYPTVRVLILSFHKDEKHIGRLVKAGVAGYVIKDRGIGELVKAIRAVASGDIYYDQEVMRVGMQMVKGVQGTDGPVKLTRREEEILDYIAEGMSSKEIAEKIFRAESTVETHRKNLLEKLNLPNSKQLMKYALEKGYGKGKI